MANQSYIDNLVAIKRSQQTEYRPPVKLDKFAPKPVGNSYQKVMLQEFKIISDLEIHWVVLTDRGAQITLRLPKNNLTSVSFGKRQTPGSWFEIDAQEISPGFYEAPNIKKL
jgi:hypothetical protein